MLTRIRSKLMNESFKHLRGRKSRLQSLAAIITSKSIRVMQGFTIAWLSKKLSRRRLKRSRLTSRSARLKVTFLQPHLPILEFIVIVILEADRLSKDAQHALRRTMEKYSGNLRLILSCNSTGRLIGPIKSRCLLVRVPGLDEAKMENFLRKTAHKESIKLNAEASQMISTSAGGNMRTALLLLEAFSVK